jgi:putative transferase (TIGR04331 family)
MNEFSSLYVTDAWNHHIYSSIIKNFTKIPFTEIKKNITKNFNKNNSYFNLNFVKKKILLFIENFFKFYIKKNNFFFINTYLPFKQEFFLKLLLKQIPIITLEIENVINKKIDFDARKIIDLKSKEYSGFESCIRTLIPENIPTIYLENYNSANDLVSNVCWPNKPKTIITGVNFHYDDIFKIWTASKVESKTELIIMQHGGSMGTAKFNSSLDHQIKIADKFITSGWRHDSNDWSNDQNKLYPFGIIKNIRNENPSTNKKGNIFMFGSVFPRYSYAMGSYPASANQVIKHIHDQFSFVENISEKQFDRLRLRLFSPDWGWEQKKRWSDKFPRLKFSTQKIDSVYKQARVCIMNYDSTTLIESLSRNIPTIVFLDPLIFTLHDRARIYFDEIFKFGILKNTPIDAANQLNIVWNHLEDWWCNKDLQYSVKYFCDYFANNKKENIFNLRDCILK